MSHLSPEELLDLAEEAARPDLAAHVEACDVCRQEVAELKSMLSATRVPDVPEPSPLFWDHLSARVSTAIREDQAADPAPWSWVGLRWRLAAAVSLAAVVLAVGWSLQMRRSEIPRLPADQIVNLDANVPNVSLADDVTLGLIADLASDLEWDAAADEGLTVDRGMIEHAVSELNDDERAELRRMLNEAMAGRGV